HSRRDEVVAVGQLLGIVGVKKLRAVVKSSSTQIPMSGPKVISVEHDFPCPIDLDNSVVVRIGDQYIPARSGICRVHKVEGWVYVRPHYFPSRAELNHLR